jgi:hypothetical protein
MLVNDTTESSGVFRDRARDTVAGYHRILRIEAALRELIIEELSKIAGQKWHKQRLPSDLSPKLSEGPKYERAYKWIEFIPHHPICYLDFPDLPKIIARADNWRDCFERYFGNKDSFQSKFRDIELVRNKIAHSRLITSSELAKISAFELEISTAIGASAYNDLLERYLPVGDIAAQLNALSSYFADAANVVRQAHCLTIPESIGKVLGSWWFEPSYIPLDASELATTMKLLEQYINLPRQPRDGYLIEKWVKDNELEQFLTRLSLATHSLAKEA